MLTSPVRYVLLVIICSLGGISNCIAKEIAEIKFDDNSSLDEISGIVVDRTITLMGHVFYRDFTNYRQLNNPDSKYNLTIFERPSARWGSLIWIEYQSKKIYKTFLSPGRTSYQQVAEHSAKQIEEKLNKIRLQELFSDHIDLERDEI